MIGKNRRSKIPPSTQALMPSGSPVRIEAKISSEMPLPIPRFVISSPIHIRSAQPAVSVRTISAPRPKFASSAPWRWNRNAKPAAWAAARMIVR